MILYKLCNKLKRKRRNNIFKKSISCSHNDFKIVGNTVIAGQCYIIDMDHGMRKEELISKQDNSAKAVIIGNDVWIGANATILKGPLIHDGAVIAVHNAESRKQNEEN